MLHASPSTLNAKSVHPHPKSVTLTQFGAPAPGARNSPGSPMIRPLPAVAQYHWSFGVAATPVTETQYVLPPSSHRSVRLNSAVHTRRPDIVWPVSVRGVTSTDSS